MAATLAAHTSHNAAEPEPAAVEPRPKPLFGGIGPAEAGRRSAIAARERKAEAEAEATSVSVTTAELKRLKRRLLELAEGKHNASPTAQIQAARALQEWVKLTPEQPVEQVEQLDREARKARREQLERAAREESNTSKGAHASSAEQGQSAPQAPAAS